jgi:hypothetical protein
MLITATATNDALYRPKRQQIVRKLGLLEYSLYNSRHHWAATRLRAGMPPQIVQ